MALSTNREVDRFVDQELRSYAVAAAATIRKGGFVGVNTSGYARPLTAGDAFAGVAYEQADNSAGANGAIAGRVYTQGDFVLTLSGATVGSIGRPVFASDDEVLTFTAVGNSYVGIMVGLHATNQIVLRIDPNRRAVKTIAHAVEDLAAGADIAARAVHAFNGEGWIVAARVVNQASSASGIDNSNTCVVAVGINAGTVASKTYNATTSFPGANAADLLGAITNAHAAAGDVLTLAVTNGSTANPGPFVVEVDYV
jgi:hypothetical protein